MIFTLAWRNLWRNRRRTFITTGSIVLAVVLAVFMRSMQEGVYQKMIENVVGFYTGYAQVHQAGYWEEKTIDNSFESMTALDEARAANPRIVGVVPRLESFLLVYHGNASQVAQVVGISPEEENGLTQLGGMVKEGEYLRLDDQSVMIGSGLAKKLNAGIGDTLVLFGQGYQGSTASELLPVSGILQFGSQQLNDRMLYLPLPVAQGLFAAPDRLTAYALDLQAPGDEVAVTAALKSSLPEDYEVMDWREMMPELVQSIESDRLGGYLTMGILYLIIGFGIFGTALMMVAERQYEFGVLTAIGMKRRLLSQVMTAEMVLMALLGVVIGVAIALPVVVYFHYNPFEITGKAAEGYAAFGIEPIIPTAISGSIIAWQTLVVLLMTLAVSIYPVIKILRIDPVKAMRV